MNRKAVLCMILCILMILPLAACGEGTAHQKQLFAMNTMFTLTAYGKRGQAGVNAAEATVVAIDAMSDPDVETSTVYALNHAEGAQVNVSGQVAEMLLDAQEVYDRTGGAYDITIYPLVDLWGFTDGRYYVPSQDEIYIQLGNLCMDLLTISKFPTSGTYTVQFPYYGKLSFDSCARGCAAKYAIDAMRKNGVESGIVSLAGNIQTLGNKPDGSLWSVGITDPNNPSGYLGVLSVGEAAICTTGSYQKYMPSNPKYHHVLSTMNGYPTTNGLLSVTVIAEDGTMADCLSTAMFALGQSRAVNYWRQYGGFDMIMITGDGQIICTSGLLEEFDLRNSNYTLRYVE
ncbi:MAG: FAD:protein FMN transferase [Oscillospiraceae bacterium]|nr:FAD:protein FMN transferase [Oscillospiraceae bacterium]